MFGLDNRRFMVSGNRKRIFFSPQCPGRLWSPTKPHIQGAFRVLSQKLKREGCKAERSHPSRLRTNGALTSLPPCVHGVYSTRTVLCLFLCNSSASLHSMQQSSSSEFLRCDIPVVYQLQCRNKCEQQS